MVGTLDTGWLDALDRIQRARQKPHYMPAMLLATLDLLEEQRLLLPFVPFLAVEERFEALLRGRSLPGQDKGWDPFFHLSGRAGVWTLYLGEREADFSDLATEAGRSGPRPKGRAGLLRRADRARFREQLVPQLVTVQGRAPLYRWLESMLAG